MFTGLKWLIGASVLLPLSSAVQATSIPDDQKTSVYVSQPILAVAESAKLNGQLLKKLKKKLPKIPSGRPDTVEEDAKNTTRPRRNTDDVSSVKETFEEIKLFQLWSTEFRRDEQSALKNADEKLMNFRSQMAARITPEFIKLANTPGNTRAKSLQRKAGNRARAAAAWITDVNLEEWKAKTGPGLLTGKYAQIFSEYERILVLERIYPDNADIASAKATADAVIGEIGTFADARRQAEANYAARIASTRLAPARRRNAGLEGAMNRAFRASPWTQKEFKGSQILKTHITDGGWTVERNRVTGIAISRYQRAQLGVKTADGKCYAYSVIFEQKHTGGGRYGGTYMASGSPREMLCENI